MMWGIILFVWLYRWFPSVLSAIAIRRPETIIGWHREGFQSYRRERSRKPVGRPRISAELRNLVGVMSRANHLWGAPHIHGELLKLGFTIAQSTVARYMYRGWPPSQGWRIFLTNHVDGIAAIDLFVLPTITFRLLYCLVIMRHGRRLWVLRRQVSKRPQLSNTDSRSSSIIGWQGYRVSAPRLAESNFRYTHSNPDILQRTARGAKLEPCTADWNACRQNANRRRRVRTMNDRSTQLYFEDFAIGQQYEGCLRTISQADVLAFASLTGDAHPIHYDPEYARQTRFGRPIVHGLHLMALTALGATPLSARLAEAMIALVEQGAAFLKPVFVDDSVRSAFEITELEQKPGREWGRVKFRATLTNQRGETVLEASHTYRLRCRSVAAGSLKR